MNDDPSLVDQEGWYDKARFYWNTLTISNSFKTSQSLQHARSALNITLMPLFKMCQSLVAKRKKTCILWLFQSIWVSTVAVFMGHFCIGDLLSNAHCSLRVWGKNFENQNWTVSHRFQILKTNWFSDEIISNKKNANNNMPWASLFQIEQFLWQNDSGIFSRGQGWSACGISQSWRLCKQN